MAVAFGPVLPSHNVGNSSLGSNGHNPQLNHIRPGVGRPMANNGNIVNQRGGLDASLYQMCIKLRRRFNDVPGFEGYLRDMEEEEADMGDNTDPVTSMWNLLRRGTPLVTLYNALQPAEPILIKQSLVSNDDRAGKQATFQFLQKCMKELQFPPSECFFITDLMLSDTNGLAKVLKVVNRVLDILEERGLVITSVDKNGAEEASKPKSHQENVIHEIVTTERDYMQHLETLQQFQAYLQHANILPGDKLHSIFMNLNKLLDFQRRFLVRIEQQNALDPQLQNWGQLFSMYHEGFQVYEPFIANQTSCVETVNKEWPAIRAAPLPPAFQGMVETQSVLLGFLLKPFQRLVKYPMFLEQLIKKGDYDEERIEDLRAGIKATNSILESANEAVAKEARAAAWAELQGNVDDWKGHNLKEFGELVIFGAQSVLKSEGPKETEREYKLYLFQNILLCCSEINHNKAKNRLTSKGNLKGKQKLKLKGRIFMANVTDMMTFARNNSYYLNIFWKADPAIENFTIRYINQDTRDKWAKLINEQRTKLKPEKDGRFSGSAQFTSLTGTTLVNPHVQQEEEDDDDDEIRYTPTTNSMSSDLTTSRNASSTSLRSRSATGGSGPTPPSLQGRMPPPRFPLPEPVYGSNGQPLKIATHFQPGTPDQINLQSYFSPTGESPSSSIRSSSQAGTFPFPRQSTSSSNNSWMVESTKHMTAPAMGRSPHRDEDLANGYGRNQRPSLPPQTISHAQQLSLAQRTRSASTPQVQPPPTNAAQRAYGHQPAEDVPVPPLPPHMQQMRGVPSRSNSNSPTDAYRGARGQSSAPPALTRNAQTFPNNVYDPAQYLQRSDPRYHQQGGIGSSPTSSASTARMTSPARQHAQSQARRHGQGEGSQGQTLMRMPDPAPASLKVKVFFEPKPSHVTIVANPGIRFRSLIDRIDSKMERVTSSSIAKGTARLKYSDPEDEMITIGNDDDIKIAVEEWVEVNSSALRNGISPDFELHWIEIGAGLSGGSGGYPAI